jgi:tetratricopeptide (TPR) repeat protein
MEQMSMENDEIVKRLAGLEKELASIRALVSPARPGNHVVEHLRGAARFLLTYWVLLSFLFAGATVIYVKYKHDIDYFEQYQNQATRKDLAEFYRQLGDRMLARAEWESATSAYQEALKINPHNKDASINLAKAQVFSPHSDHKYVAPEVIDVKLQYLEALYPNDYIVTFLKGIRLMNMGEFDAAWIALKRSIEIHRERQEDVARQQESETIPAFPGAYVHLGYIAQNRSDLDAAIEYNRKALELDPEFPQALNNLGFLYLLSARYPEAIEHLSYADRISPNLLTGINLGDAYRYQGNYQRARDIHFSVLRNAINLADDYERYLGGEWTYNYMPLSDGDTETIKNRIWVFTQEQKLAIAHFALALDNAMNGDVTAANRELDEAVQLEGRRHYRAFYANKIAFLQRFPKTGDRSQAWLREQRAKLAGK